MAINTRFRLVQSIVDEFWKKWTELCAPALIVQRKWDTTQRNLQPGDVVVIADRNTLRGEYRFGQVENVLLSADGKVRQATIRYKSYKVGEKVRRYTGARDIVVTRVHRLAVWVPVDFKLEDADEEFKASLIKDF